LQDPDVDQLLDVVGVDPGSPGHILARVLPHRDAIVAGGSTPVCPAFEGLRMGTRCKFPVESWRVDESSSSRKIVVKRGSLPPARVRAPCTTVGSSMVPSAAVMGAASRGGASAPGLVLAAVAGMGFSVAAAMQKHEAVRFDERPFRLLQRLAGRWLWLAALVIDGASWMAQASAL